MGFLLASIDISIENEGLRAVGGAIFIEHVRDNRNNTHFGCSTIQFCMKSIFTMH